jgi:16S rRNA (cytosine967-C5)-methyltransferase
MIPLDRLDALVVTLWIQQKKGSRSSAMQLMRALFREEGLRSKQQKRVKTLFHQWLSDEALVEFALEQAAPGGIIEVLAGPMRLLVSRVISGDLTPKEARAKIPWVNWEEVSGVLQEVEAIRDVPRRLELLGSISPWLARRLWEVYGLEAQACLEGLRGKPPVTIRTNQLWGTRDELQERLSEEGIETFPCRYAPLGLSLQKPAQLLRSKAFAEGAFELQDEASQLVSTLVNPPPGGLVLDVCAGAGGKALALAGMVGPTGRVVALDTSSSRLTDLRRRARRAQAAHIEGFRVRADAWPLRIEGIGKRADRILVDAPCCGLGSLRRNPDLRSRIDENEVRRVRSIQLRLLERAARVLAPGARLIYSTCTLLPEENEEIVEEVCQRVPQLEILPVSTVWEEALGGVTVFPFTREDGLFFQSFPHRDGMDGFFGAVLQLRDVKKAPD